MARRLDNTAGWPKDKRLRRNVMIGRKVRQACFVAVLLGVLVAAAGVARGQYVDPYAPIVTMSITPPSGSAQQVEARESQTIMLKVGDVEYKFRPTILDAKPWNQIVVTIFKGATAEQADQVLGTVDVKTGAPAVASQTNPVFRIAVPKVTAAPNPAEKK
jgi:hypothetical protein